ncbi:MAG TPA: hypothetical protein P5164_05135 [Thermoanaerobaculia bacterium]|nr:hypothetical protein [Thermoanaerobaculia bacterium]
MILALVLLALAGPPSASATPSSAPPRETGAPAFGPEWRKLLGEWKGGGSGAPGAGGGGSSFRLELDGHVLVRRNVADYPAAEGRPAAHHEDLLVVSPGATPSTGSAVYFDNEGHVIRYDASWSADGAVLTLVSDAAAPGPRFRLTYACPAPDEMTVTFEVAPPGGAFRRYLGGDLRRVAR